MDKKENNQKTQGDGSVWKDWPSLCLAAFLALIATCSVVVDGVYVAIATGFSMPGFVWVLSGIVSYILFYGGFIKTGDWGMALHIYIKRRRGKVKVTQQHNNKENS